MIGVAVRVTVAPDANRALLAEQVVPQLIPLGALATEPVPLLVTAKVYLGRAVKVALTLFAPVMATVQLLPLTLVQPVQLAN